MELVLRPRKGWQAIDFHEMWSYRELLLFLIWRDIKIRYRQTVLGGIWAVLQPLLAMLIFTVLFNRVAGIRSDGSPYALFSFSGLTAWTFFANAITASSNSLIGNEQLISKVYFPRIFVPLGAIGALLLDLLLGLLLMGVLMFFYRWPLTLSVFWTPFFVVGTVLAAGGLGLLFSALNVSYRDVKYAVPFIVQMGFFMTPIIYPMGYLSSKVQLLMGLNPMAGMVQGFRHSLLGAPVDWRVVGLSFVVSFILFVAGTFIFRRMERRFADVI